MCKSGGVCACGGECDTCGGECDTKVWLKMATALFCLFLLHKRGLGCTGVV